jgi:hypothetical protein
VRVTLNEADFFTSDWKRVIGELPEPILLLGNPPWVTNAGLGTLGSENLPFKSNLHKHNGLDAITGKANFDISEWMLIRLMEAMVGRTGTLAMLCKASVARKVLAYAWKKSFPIEQSAIYAIDAAAHFDAAVDAVLLVTHFQPLSAETTATIHPNLENNLAEKTIGHQAGQLIADLAAYELRKNLCGEVWMKWRSGIKHDCSKVMELQRNAATFRNGFDEVVEIENDCLYPMLKSSDVAQGRTVGGKRWMLVPQKTMSDETAKLQDTAPKTWAYLNDHAADLNRRASSIYRGRPPFSVFGVGEYSFAPWKVAISGFYKKLSFVVVEPFEGKPTVLDDTVYFLSFETQEQADYVNSLLNSSVAQEFYGAFVFWDSKRPITVDLLRRLDLRRLAKELGSSSLNYGRPSHIGPTVPSKP